VFEIVGPDRTADKLQGVDVVTPVNTNTAGPEIEGTKKP
jgi:SP family general alpha glucoside:H+ symporter-like MFS transporter